MSSRSSIAKIVFVVSIAALAACTSTPKTQVSTALDDDAITVGSFDFEESALLAEMYSQALEGRGFVVDRRFEIGPRELVLPALSAGFIEFVPEYLGTALQFLSLGASAQGADTSSSHKALDDTLRSGKLIALESSPAQDVNAFFVTQETADRDELTDLSDVAKVDEHLRFGGPAECPARPLCLAGLRDRYGLSFQDVVALDAGGPLTRQALRDGAIDIALLFTTDPVIDAEGFVELRDDRRLQPPENVTPLVRAEVVDRWGTEFVHAVDAVSEHITTAQLRELNGRVTRGEGDIASIARSWLAEQGLS